MTQDRTGNVDHVENREPARGLTHSILAGLLWTLVGTGGQAMLRLLVLVILARLLTPADFGTVSAALVVVGFTTIFSQLGVGPAVVQRPTLEAVHLRTGFTLSLLFGSVTTGLICALAPVTADFFRIPELTPVVQVLSVVFLISGASVVAESLMQREMRFRQLAVINLVAFGMGYGAVGVGLALLRFGVWALVGAQLAQTVLKTGISLFVRPHPMRPSLERRAAGDLMYFGGGFTVARIGNYLASQLDNLVVGRWLGASALGIYGRAYQLMAAPAMFVGEILDRVLFPAMVKVQNQPERLGAAYRKSISLIALLTLPVSGILVILAPEVVRVLLGPAWPEVVVPFRIFAAGLLLRTSYKMSDSLVRATGAVYRRAWRQVVYAILVVAGAWVGRGWGVSGVALGVLGAIGVNFLLMAHLSLSLANVTWKGIWTAHLHAFNLTALLGAETWLLALLLRAAGLGPLPLLLITAIAGFGITCLLLRYAPQYTFGAEGVWMLRTLSGYIPERVNPLVWVGKGMRQKVGLEKS